MTAVMSGFDWPTVAIAFGGSLGLAAIAVSIFPTRPIRRPRSDSEQQ